MARRNVTTTVKVTREKRVEFSAADLRKRLRLPDDAALGLQVAGTTDKAWTIADDADTLVATWTTTTEPKREGSA